MDKGLDGSAGASPTLAPLKPNFLTIWRLLDPKDWLPESSHPLEDMVCHKRYDIRFYADCNGVRYRNKAGDALYEPWVPTFMLLHIKTRDFLKRVKWANGLASKPKRPMIVPLPGREASVNPEGVNRQDPPVTSKLPAEEKGKT